MARAEFVNHQDFINALEVFGLAKGLMMRETTESLLVQLEHVWALRRTVRQLAAGSVLESADELGSHLDEIRIATLNCSDIAGATGKARDHSLRFILRCHQGEASDQLRFEALRSINDLEDEILRFRVVGEDPDPALTPIMDEPQAVSLRVSASFGMPIDRAYVLRGDPVVHAQGRYSFDNAPTLATMP